MEEKSLGKQWFLRFSGKLIGAKLSLNNRCVCSTVMEIENIAQGLNTDENLIRDYIFCVRWQCFIHVLQATTTYLTDEIKRPCHREG